MSMVLRQLQAGCLMLASLLGFAWFSADTAGHSLSQTREPGRGGGVPFELEGPLMRVAPEGGELLVMGLKVVVPPGAQIRSPAADLTIADLSGAPLPGRSQPGFVGGTAIITGITTNGVNIAEEVFVEPAEHVLLGAVTSVTRLRFEILGVHVRTIADPRMATTVVHPLGFDIHLHSVPAGSLAAAEGYIGDDGALYAVHIEAEGSLVQQGPQTSILRLSCADNRFEIRGGSTSATGTFHVYDHQNSQLLGSAPVEPAEITGMGRYRLNVTLSSPCPATVRVENSNGSSAIATLR
jgi:hypothetical protein